ncbi:hypothetical protein [Rubellimicrobium arenae]|uniref:hypothetical protein n=1 Tax=Rubellimicrobium arenae TaxID=2817372 RepID=UPI001B302730|nr:hypothetical protein [Rubellimicrobium arenae]
MIRSLSICLVLLLGACTQGANPVSLLNPAEAQRRGAVEVAVKSTFPGILDEIEAGGGPAISGAMDAAGVPAQDRPARLLQLRGDLGLYESNPAALAAALVVYGR